MMNENFSIFSPQKVGEALLLKRNMIEKFITGEIELFHVSFVLYYPKKIYCLYRTDNFFIS